MMAITGIQMMLMLQIGATFGKDPDMRADVGAAADRRRRLRLARAGARALRLHPGRRDLDQVGDRSRQAGSCWSCRPRGGWLPKPPESRGAENCRRSRPADRAKRSPLALRPTPSTPATWPRRCCSRLSRLRPPLPRTATARTAVRRPRVPSSRSSSRLQ